MERNLRGDLGPHQQIQIDTQESRSVILHPVTVQVPDDVMGSFVQRGCYIASTGTAVFPALYTHAVASRHTP